MWRHIYCETWLVWHELLQCVAVCCSVLQCLSSQVTCIIISDDHVTSNISWDMTRVTWIVGPCCSVLQRVTVSIIKGGMHHDVRRSCIVKYVERHDSCDANSYSVLQCVAVCCSVLQRVTVSSIKSDTTVTWLVWNGLLQCVAVRCSVLQCVAVCCSVSQCLVSRVTQGWHAS